MTKITNWIKANKICFASYGIAFAVLLIALAALGMSPFGERDILKIDMYHAYAPEMMQFRDIITEGNSWFHTWTGALGSNSLSLLIFHILSPFSAFVLMFPRDAINEACTIMLLFKIPVTAFTMAFFLRHKFGRSDMLTAAFSVMFALCAFITAYYWSYPWIDVIFMLPLVALGIERLVKEGRGVLYCLSLAYAIYAYFYMAAFLCMFAVMYFAATVFLDYKRRGEVGAVTKLAFKFLGLSVLAAALTLFVNIPVIITLSGTPYLQGAGLGRFQIFNIFKFLSSHFWGLDPAMREGTDIAGPNIFAGLLPLVLLPFYYINKKIPKREKIAFSVMLGLVALVMEVSILNYMAHLMHQPAGLPYRMSFIYSFILLIMGFRSIGELEARSTKRVPYIIAGFGGVIMLLYIFSGNTGAVPVPASFTIGAAIANIALIAVYLCIIHAAKPTAAGGFSRKFSAILLAVVCLEMGYSTYYNFNYERNSAASADEFYRDYEDDMAKVRQKLDAQPGFYRATFHRTGVICDAKLYNLRDITQFIAPTSASMLDIMAALGVTSSMNSIIFIDPTPFVSSILAVKNTLTRNYFVGDYLYKVQEQIGKVVIYDNPYVLPVGFMVDQSAIDWDIKSSKSTFALQNDLASRMTGRRVRFFNEFLPDSFTSERAKITKTGDNTFSYVLDDPSNLTEKAVIKIGFVMPESARLYLNYKASACANVKVYAVDENRREYTGAEGTGTGMDAGYMEKGTKIEVVFTHDQLNPRNKLSYEKSGTIELYAAQIDMPAFEQTIDTLKTQPYTVDSYDDEHVSGTVTATRDGLLYTSIPYDAAWTITVDGAAVTPQKLGGALTAIYLKAGTHRVEFVYNQQGLVAGMIATQCAIVVLAVYAVVQRRKSRQHKQTAA